MTGVEIREAATTGVQIREFIAARLAEAQRAAETMEHFTVHEQEYYSCPASLTEPLGDLPWGEGTCDCHLAERKARALREVGFRRAVLAAYEASVRSLGEGLSAVERRMCLHLAAIWSDHPDYSPAWAPEPVSA
jgi:Family of unknown function (DUF6221)